MRIRHLQEPLQIVEVIGRKRLQEITRRQSACVTNWLDAGYFPPYTYVVMTLELRRHRYRAPLKLWRMIEPQKRAA